MKLGLRGKFLFPTLMLILIGLAFTAGVSVYNSRNMLQEQMVEQLQQNAGSTRDYIVSWVENRKQDVFLWSKHSSVIQGTKMQADMGADGGGGIFIHEINELVSMYKKAQPYYEDIGVVTVDGSVLTNTFATKETGLKGTVYDGTDVKDRDYFQKAMKGEQVMTEVRPSETSGRPVFILSAPIHYSDDGRNYYVIGVLYAVVDLPYFTRKFVDPMKIGQKGYIFIYDEEGMILSHPDKTRIMNENLKSSEHGRKMIEQGNGLIKYEHEGNDLMVAFNRDQDLGWSVAAVADVDELMAPVRHLARLNIFLMIFVLVVAVVLIIWVAAMVSRPINKITSSLGMVARQVSNASKQIAVSSQQLAQGASAQASSIEETSASLEELASMANHNADNAQQASNLSSEARQAATNGAQSMDNLVQAMEGINQSSQEVAKVAKGIEEIAFQTNLLALNAAVEAARAGEAGRGFAVVAEEVRNLAQRSSEQARTTTTLITESRSRTSEGTKQAGEANRVLKVILESVEKVVGLVSEISAASKEQAQGIDQINRAVSTMDQIVQQNSASSEESASASQQLTAQAFHMKTLVHQLGVLVSGANEAEGAQDDAAPDAKRGTLKSLRQAPPGEKGGSPQALPMMPTGGEGKPVEVRAEELIPFDDDEMDDF